VTHGGNNKKSPSFHPDAKYLSSLMEMGFSLNKSTKALFFTGNDNLEKAVNWAMEHISDPADLPLTAEQIASTQSNDVDATPLDSGDVFSTEIFNEIYGHAPEEYKLVLCVRQDLKMSTGKIASQCCHAALGVYRRMQHSCPGILRAWERTGEKKIVVGINSSQELEELELRALKYNLPVCVARDAGLTEIASGTRTVVGIAGPAGTVDNVTSHLKLLK